MFGGPPMMPAQQFAPQYAMPAQPYNVPAAMASVAPARPAPPSQPMTTTPPRPVVRAQAPDPPALPAGRPVAPSAPPAGERAAPLAPEQPALVNLPAPEQLGVTTAGTMDWSSTHARMEKLGVTCFQEERLTNGACRVTCVLPMGNSGQTHRIEAEASNAAEAVQVALSEAESWKAQR